MAHEQPVAIPDRLHVELEVILIDVEGLLKAEAFAAVLQLAQCRGLQVHVVLVFHNRRMRSAARHRPLGWAEHGYPRPPAATLISVSRGWFPGSGVVHLRTALAPSQGLPQWLCAEAHSPPPLRGQRRVEVCDLHRLPNSPEDLPSPGTSSIAI
mgnify:CR=1 FL=1